MRIKITVLAASAVLNFSVAIHVLPTVEVQIGPSTTEKHKGQGREVGDIKPKGQTRDTATGAQAAKQLRSPSDKPSRAIGDYN